MAGARHRPLAVDDSCSRRVPSSQMVLTPFSGDPNMYVSLTEPRPNATSATWVSEELSGEVVKISSRDRTLAACASSGTTCVVYTSVHALTLLVFK